MQNREQIKTHIEKVERALKDRRRTIALEFHTEFSKTGVLKSFFKKIQNNEKVDARFMTREMVLQNCIASIVEYLNQMVSETKVI